jgi:flagellar basal-body rod protein FlgC
MAFDRALRISESGITAERIAMELIASNIANINTTRAIDGTPYRRLVPVFAQQQLSFSEELAKAQKKVMGGGVIIADVKEDQTPFPKVYNPSHPDADKDGFVSLPNVNLSDEMVKQIQVSRMYEANITAFNATKKMLQDTMQLP